MSADHEDAGLIDRRRWQGIYDLASDLFLMMFVGGLLFFGVDRLVTRKSFWLEFIFVLPVTIASMVVGQIFVYWLKKRKLAENTTLPLPGHEDA